MLLCSKPNFIYELSEGVFSFGKAASDGSFSRCFKVGCGVCDWCRLQKGGDMSLRCMHEALMRGWEVSNFLTLTYDDSHLPPGGELVKAHAQGFVRSLRKRRRGAKFVYVSKGEYGGQFGRPHYHFLVFGLLLSDLVHWSGSRGTVSALSRSPFLEEVWGKGMCVVAPVTPASAAYVAGYMDKAGDSSAIDAVTGELFARPPPFRTFSTRPAIGAGYLARHAGQVWAHPNIVDTDGVQRPVPRYYAKVLKREDPERFVDWQSRRVEAAESPVSLARNSEYHVEARRQLVARRLSMARKSPGLLRGDS